MGLSEISGRHSGPLRFDTVFRGKPLARLGGEPVIRHVWKQVTQVFADAAVAHRRSAHLRCGGGLRRPCRHDLARSSQRHRPLSGSRRQTGRRPRRHRQRTGRRTLHRPPRSCRRSPAASTIRRPTSPRSSNPSPRPTDSTHWKIPIRRKSCSAARARHSISRAR